MSSLSNNLPFSYLLVVKHLSIKLEKRLEEWIIRTKLTP